MNARRVDKLHKDFFEEPTLPYPTIVFYVTFQNTFLATIKVGGNLALDNLVCP